MSDQHAADSHGHVFISYVREDRDRVDRLQTSLEAAGLGVWRDTASIWPGQDWQLQIRGAIRDGSLAFIACFSENSQGKNSSYQNEELILAVEQMRVRHPGTSWLIPVRFAECSIPAFDLGAGRMLDSLQHVDLFDGIWEQGMPRILGAVRRILGDRPGHSRAGTYAVMPSADISASVSSQGTVGAADGELADAYNRGLAALYTERWDEAVHAFLVLTNGGRQYRDSAARLDQARRGQGIPGLYVAACQAADDGRWGEALRQFEALEEAEPGYRDVPARLERARREHARAEVADLHGAGQWQDAVEAGQRLAALSPGDPGPGGLVADARAELAAAEHARVIAAAYQRVLRHIGEGEWAAAFVALAFIVRTDPEYEHAAQLADRARRELARSAPRIAGAALVSVLSSGEWFGPTAFSPDDTRLALGRGNGGGAVIIGLDGRAAILLHYDTPGLENGYMSFVAFDPSGRRLITAGSDNTTRIWDAASGTQLLKITGNARQSSVALSPDGTMIAGVGENSDFVAVIWDAASGKEIISSSPDYEPSTERTTGVMFSPDGRKLATITPGPFAQPAVQVWDIQSRGLVLELDHPAAVKELAFSPDGNVLATTSDDHIVRIWDIADGKIFLELPHPGWLGSVSFSPDGRVLAVASAGSAWFWDWITGDQLSKVAAMGSLAFSNNGRFFAASDQDSAGRPKMCLWRLTGDKEGYSRHPVEVQSNNG